MVGAVADVKYEAIDRPAGPALYLAARPAAGGGGQFQTHLFVRARTAPAATVAAIRNQVGAADPGLAMYDVTTMADVVRVAASSTRFVTALLVGFALAAAFLAALGVYGVLAYLVTQRTREFGIRIAVGASPGWVLAHIVRQGAALTGVGIGLGILAALGATGVLSRFLYGVARADALTYAAIALLVGVVGTVAALVPARRATRVDPAVALRTE